ncbi:restriction endonuclease [Streptomyces microflavus]|uniref:restriction endonuclease n=1 Tax=Streptomyces microflavus TaxID=1919 RepID=UPI0038223902
MASITTGIARLLADDPGTAILHGQVARMCATRPVRRRTPPYRRSRKRPERRQQRRDTQVFLLAAGTAAGLALAWAVISWLLGNWWALIVLGAIAAVGGTVWVHRYRQQQAWDRGRQQALRYGLPQLDALHHRDFEYAIRDLMRRDGCADARQIGGAGDNGADVLATDPLGRTWVIQAKHRKDGDRGSAVGTPDLQRDNGYRPPAIWRRRLVARSRTGPQGGS